jgi:hypothetical protein
MKSATGLIYVVAGLLLVGCGTLEERAPFYGVSREDALQISRILREAKHVQKIRQYYRQEDGAILVLTDQGMFKAYKDRGKWVVIEAVIIA